MNQTERRAFLLRELLKEDARFQDRAIPAGEREQRELLRALMNVRPARPVSDEFLHVQDEYLQQAIAERGVTHPEDLSPADGAGRLYSRTQAEQSFTLSDFKKSMEGIFSSSVSADTLDECPMAYKDPQTIINAIGDTVRIDKQIRPIYNFKSSDRFASKRKKLIILLSHKNSTFAAV